MRKEFSWYFDHLETNHQTLWDDAILSIDANVLLDLYRYHKDTSETILTALESFKDRVWLTHQAASEFIKNRKSVIVDASNAIAKSATYLTEIRKANEKAKQDLTNQRVLSRSIIDALYSDVDNAISGASTKIEGERSASPDHLNNDDILRRILKIFDGRVGAPPTDFEEAKKEAIFRIERQIPPGYMDKKKDDDGALGDYFVWRQLLQFAKNKKKAIIFVTSDAKEDWWEIRSGRTLGPRQELLKEASIEAGYQVAIYQLENFLRHHKTASNQPNGSESAIKEVIALAEERFTNKRYQLVQKEQQVFYADERENYGIIEVYLTRPAPNFTVTGHLSPNFKSSPRVNIELSEAPDDIDVIDCFVNTGTKFDFNVHVKSQVKRHLLPEGLYIFNYDASCIDE